jgi:hypothetical protein
MRAIVDALQFSARCLNHFAKLRVHVNQRIEGKKASSDARLIRDDDEPKACAVEADQTLGGAWQQFQAIGVAEISSIDHERPIAVQNNHGARSVRPPH